MGMILSSPDFKKYEYGVQMIAIRLLMMYETNLQSESTWLSGFDPNFHTEPMSHKITTHINNSIPKFHWGLESNTNTVYFLDLEKQIMTSAACFRVYLGEISCSEKDFLLFNAPEWNCERQLALENPSTRKLRQIVQWIWLPNRQEVQEDCELDVSFCEDGQ